MDEKQLVGLDDGEVEDGNGNALMTTIEAVRRKHLAMYHTDVVLPWWLIDPRTSKRIAWWDLTTGVRLLRPGDAVYRPSVGPKGHLLIPRARVRRR